MMADNSNGSGRRPVEEGRIRALVAAGDARSQAALLSAVKGASDIEIVGVTTDAEVALKVVRQRRPHVVIVSLNLAPLSGTELTRELQIEYGDIASIVVAEQSGLGAFKSAMHVGASDFLVMPFEGDELPAAIRRAHHFMLERADREPIARGSGRAAVDGRLVVVAGAKGGSGKTVVATGLAATAARSFPGQVSLLDLDLQFGDVDLFVNLESDRNLRSLGPVLQELDREAVNSVVQTTSSGLRVLLPPAWPEDAEMFQAEDLSALLLFFKRTCPLTIVDTGGRLDSALMAAAQDANLLLLVTTPALPALRDTAKMLASFGRLDVSLDRTAVVVNNSARTRGFDANIVARTLGQEPLAVLPFDAPAVERAMNQGVPVGAGERGALADAVEELTATVVERLDSTQLGMRPAQGVASGRGARRLMAAFAR